MVFQAGPAPVTLAQTNSGQHSYEKDFYAAPMTLC